MLSYHLLPANETIEKLFKILNDIESVTIETKAVNFFQKAFQDNEVHIKRANMKIAAIQNFPVPTTREDILEFLAQAVPLAKKPSFWSSSSCLDLEIAAAWKNKCEQIMIKAKFSMKDDSVTLEEIMNYAKILKLKI